MQKSNYMSIHLRFCCKSMSKKGISSIVPLALVVVVVVFAGLSGYLFISNSNLQGNLSSANSQVTSLQTSVTSLNSQISSLSSQNQMLNNNVTSLTEQKLSLDNQITSLDQNISSLEQQRTSLESELSIARNNASSLQTQLNQVDSQITSLQNQVSTLNKIVNLQSAIVEVHAQGFTTGAFGNASVVTFTANYSGYVVVSDLLASDYANEGVATYQQFSSSIPNSYYNAIYVPSFGIFYTFGSIISNIAIPVSPGTITVYLETADTTPQNATLTVTYYY